MKCLSQQQVLSANSRVEEYEETRKALTSGWTAKMSLAAIFILSSSAARLQPNLALKCCACGSAEEYEAFYTSPVTPGHPSSRSRAHAEGIENDVPTCSVEKITSTCHPAAAVDQRGSSPWTGQRHACSIARASTAIGTPLLAMFFLRCTAPRHAPSTVPPLALTLRL